MRLHQVRFVRQGTKLLQYVGIAFTLGAQYEVNHSAFPFPKRSPTPVTPSPQTLNHSKPKSLTPPPKHKPQTLTPPPNTLSADSLVIPLTSVRVGRGTFASTANWYRAQCLRVVWVCKWFGDKK